MPCGNFYLTPHGWVESDQPPAGAVERWKRETSRFLGKLTIDYSRQWANSMWSAERRKALREQFELPEMSVSAAFAEVSWEIPD
jgi:hypothetical protein